MIADVPVGAFLSGGVDSSAIVALMKRHASGPVKTFSLGFTIGGAYNELARRRARWPSTWAPSITSCTSSMRTSSQTLRTLVYHYDEPFGDAAGFPLYLLSRFAREHVKVVLTGDGGDELFGGYRRYAAGPAAPTYGGCPESLTRTLFPAIARAAAAVAAIEGVAQDAAHRRSGAPLCVLARALHAGAAGRTAPPEFAATAGHDPAWPYPRYYHSLNGATAARSSQPADVHRCEDTARRRLHGKDGQGHDGVQPGGPLAVARSSARRTGIPDPRPIQDPRPIDQTHPQASPARSGARRGVAEAQAAASRSRPTRGSAAS